MIKKILRIWKYPFYIQFLWWQLVARIKLKSKGVKLGPGIVFSGVPIVLMSGRGEISIGERCSLCSHSRHTALGVNHPVILNLLRPGATIRIGHDVGMSGTSICAALSVEIGAHVLLGANVAIMDTDFHALKPAGRRYNVNPEDIKSEPVFIGDNVFIGANALVLKGSRIGENSIVGAGSVVTGIIPPNVIAAGNPAKVIKTI